MFDNIASVDIGSSSIKIVKVRRGFRNFEIISLITENIDTDLAEKDHSAAVSEALDRIINQHDLTDCRIITSAPFNNLVIRKIKFPFSDINRISEVLPFEIEESIPFPAGSVVLDFQALPENEDGSRTVLAAGVHKDALTQNVDLFNHLGLNPVFCGLESTGLFRCYSYFNTVNDENVIQVDIGYKKTIINIVKDNQLTETRIFPTGIEKIVSFISNDLSVTKERALEIFKSLEIDITSKEASLKDEKYKDAGIPRKKQQAFWEETRNLFLNICNEIIVTINAYASDGYRIEFNRIIFSGGGSNVRGLSGFASDLINIPSVFMPFIQEYNDQDIKSRFSVCFGNLETYISYSDESINFLKGDHHPEGVKGLLRNYRLPVFFASSALVLLFINFFITFVLVGKNSNYYEDILKDRYMNFFNTRVIPEDPLAEAVKMLNAQKRELDLIKSITGDEDSFIMTIGFIVSSFPDTAGFDLRRLTYEGNSIVIDGEISSTAELEKFKNNLQRTNSFESITSDIRDSTPARSIFILTLRKKQ